MKRYIIILLASLMAGAVNAQDYGMSDLIVRKVDISPKEEREFYKNVYELMLTYADAADLYDELDEEHFLELFENPDIQIYNDLMSMSYEPTLSIYDYIDLFKGASLKTVKLYNIAKGNIKDEGDKWTIPVTFGKRISFSNGCGTFFDSYDFYKKDIPLTATICMQKATGKCYIQDIKVTEELKSFPKDFRVLVKKDPRDSKLDVENKLEKSSKANVRFNTLDQKLLFHGDELSYENGPVKEILDTPEGCDTKVYADYGDTKWRIRLNGGFAWNYNSLDSPGDKIEQSGKNEVGFGLDFGYIFPSKTKFKAGIFAGIGLSMNKLTMELPNVSSPGEYIDYYTESESTKDIDGDNYTRHYKFNDKIRQKFSSYDLAIPIYADLEWAFNSSVSIYADLGVKLLKSIKHDNTLDPLSFTTHGVYNKKEYGGELIIEDIKELGFGGRDGSNVEIDENDIEPQFAIKALLGAGLRYNITKSFALDAGVQFQVGSNTWKAPNTATFFKYSQPSGDNMSDAEKLEAENAKDKLNIMRWSKGVKQNALRVAISLIYKF